MVQSVQDDLKDIREQRKNHDKARERYEGLTGRFGALPKQKEYSLVREDTFQLYEGRRQYFQQMLAYVVRICKFKTGADMFFVEKCLGTVDELTEFTGAMAAMIEAMGMPMTTMKGQLTEWQKEAKMLVGKLEKNTAAALARVKAKYSPGSPFEPTKGVEKEGYLFKRRQKGLGLGWKRVYVAIRGDVFIQFSPGPKRGTVESSFAMNVLLCEVRPADADRRYCFEVHTSRKTFCYQAESEEDLRDWIRVFDNAKNHALRGTIGGSNSDGTDPILPSITEKIEGTEDNDSTASDSGEGAEFGKFTFLPYPPSETLLVSFSCLWTEPTANTICFGRIYGTERGVYYGSSLFGVQQGSAHPWTEITELSFSMGEITGCLLIKEGDSGPIKTTTFLNEQQSYDTLMALWKNARSDVPRSVTELQLKLQRPLRGTTSEVVEDVVEGEVSCGCVDHLERTEIDVVLPLAVDDLFTMLMGPASPVLKAVQQQRGYKNIRMTEWQLGASGQEERSIRQIIPVNHPLVKVKETECFEEHLLLKRDPGRCYVVKQTARTPGVVYGDTFATLTLFCMTHHSAGHSRLRAHVGLHWLKSPLVKAMIRGGTLKGLAEYMAVYRQALYTELRKASPDVAQEVEEIEARHKEEQEEERAERKEQSWWNEQLELVKEFWEDVRQRWRQNLDDAGVSRASFIVLLTSILLFFMSITLFLWRRPIPSKDFTFPLDYERPIQFSLEEKWLSPINHELYLSLAESHSNYRELRQDLQLVLQNINSAECRLFQTQYITWLADRLSSCYADLSHSASACVDLDAAWSAALQRNFCS
jgi:hypothetical protein